MKKLALLLLIIALSAVFTWPLIKGQRENRLARTTMEGKKAGGTANQSKPDDSDPFGLKLDSSSPAFEMSNLQWMLLKNRDRIIQYTQKDEASMRLFSKLGLDDEQRILLANMMAERNEKHGDAYRSAIAEIQEAYATKDPVTFGVGPVTLLGGDGKWVVNVYVGDIALLDKTVSDALTESGADMDIRNFLGDDGYAIFQDYERTLPYRATMEGIQVGIALKQGEKLSENLQDKFVDLMVANGVYASLGQVLPEIPQAVIEEMAPLLSSGQMAALVDAQTKNREWNRISQQAAEKWRAEHRQPAP